MAQTGAVREEPSMEDILSSIRRIIESNETEQTSDVVSSSQQVPQDQPDMTPRGSIGETSAGDISAGDFSGADDITPHVPAVEVPPHSVNVDSVSIGRATIDDNVQMSKPETISVKHQNSSEASSTQRIDASGLPVQSEEIIHNVSPDAGEDHDPQVLAQKDVEQPIAAEPQDQALNHSSSQSLISAGAEAKVSAAFAQLNDVVAAEATRNMEEIATDMLKPMLQDWLDNNLPNLVERLVREEIARVARGES